MEGKKVISAKDISQLKDKNGEVIDLPDFDEKTPFNARVKRPSLMELCLNETIPNILLAEAQQLFEGDLKKGNLLKYHDIMCKVAEVALVEPKYSEVKDMLTDEQLVVIFDYTQKGVVALLPFRQNRVFQAAISRAERDEKARVEKAKTKK